MQYRNYNIESLCSAIDADIPKIRALSENLSQSYNRIINDIAISFDWEGTVQKEVVSKIEEIKKNYKVLHDEIGNLNGIINYSTDLKTNLLEYKRIQEELVGLNSSYRLTINNLRIPNLDELEKVDLETSKRKYQNSIKDKNNRITELTLKIDSLLKKLKSVEFTKRIGDKPSGLKALLRSLTGKNNIGMYTDTATSGAGVLQTPIVDTISSATTQDSFEGQKYDTVDTISSATTQDSFDSKGTTPVTSDKLSEIEALLGRVREKNNIGMYTDTATSGAGVVQTPIVDAVSSATTQDSFDSKGTTPVTSDKLSEIEALLGRVREKNNIGMYTDTATSGAGVVQTPIVDTVIPTNTKESEEDLKMLYEIIKNKFKTEVPGGELSQLYNTYDDALNYYVKEGYSREEAIQFLNDPNISIRWIVGPNNKGIFESETAMLDDLKNADFLGISLKDTTIAEYVKNHGNGIVDSATIEESNTSISDIEVKSTPTPEPIVEANEKALVINGDLKEFFNTYVNVGLYENVTDDIIIEDGDLDIYLADIVLRRQNFTADSMQYEKFGEIIDIINQRKQNINNK